MSEDFLDEEVIPDPYKVEFKPANTPEDFKDKANKLLSNAMDLLNAKIVNEMAEASDIKTAVEIGKMFKVGIETVDEAAQRAMAEANEYAGLDDDETAFEDMRFEG